MTEHAKIDAGATTMTGILPAIAAAMGDVQKVAKGDRNKHDGYDFASIDNFLSLVNPICARHGLVIFSDELEREEFNRRGKNGESPWMRVTFSFVVHHVSGQCLPTMRRSVEVMRNGAQAYGSAQSYCLKQFLRGLFLIPTGDKDDADFERKDEGQIVRHNAPPPFDARQAADRIITALKRADSLDDLGAAWKAAGHDLVRIRDAMPEAYAECEAEKDTRKDALKPAPNADLGGDQIPY